MSKNFVLIAPLQDRLRAPGLHCPDVSLRCGTKKVRKLFEVVLTIEVLNATGTESNGLLRDGRLGYCLA